MLHQPVVSINLKLDASYLEHFFSDCRDLIALKATNWPENVRETIKSKFLDFFCESGAFEFHSVTAAGTNVCLVRPYPSQRLVDFMAAIRAGDFDFIGGGHG